MSLFVCFFLFKANRHNYKIWLQNCIHYFRINLYSKFSKSPYVQIKLKIMYDRINQLISKMFLLLFQKHSINKSTFHNLDFHVKETWIYTFLFFLKLSVCIHVYTSYSYIIGMFSLGTSHILTPSNFSRE